MSEPMCKLEVPTVKRLIEGGVSPADVLAQPVMHEVSDGERFVPVQLCECDAETGCREGRGA